MAAGRKDGGVFAENRKARHDYAVLDTVECGMVLSGTEVKSIRAGSVSLSGSYAAVTGGELWLFGADIQAYKFGNRFNHDPKARRKLLAHAKEIASLRMKTEAKGLTLVPLKIYEKSGRIKTLVGVCRGKAQRDRRETVKNRELKRETAALLKR